MAVTYVDVDLSFLKHPVSKDVIRKTDVDAVKQSLRVLFLTNPMEKKFDPNFGIGLNGMLFENMTPALSSVIKRRITEQINEYEPRCIVDALTVTQTDDTNSLVITLSFHVIGNSQTQTVTYTLLRTR